MDTSKRVNRPEHLSTSAEKIIPQSVTELEQEFSAIIQNIRKSQDKRSKATKKLIKNAIESAIDTSLSNNAISQLSTKKEKKAFRDIILDKISTRLSDEVVPSLCQADFVALNNPFKNLTQKLQALHSVSIQGGHHLESLTVSAPTNQGAGVSLSNQLAPLSIEYEPPGTSNDVTSDRNEIISTGATHQGVKLQGSLDLSDDNSIRQSNQDSEDDIKVDIKQEDGDEGKATTSADPAIFTISLGVPFSAAAERFAILFNDKRVVEGLASMSAREIWQVVRDGIQHDPDIPSRSVRRPWITEVRKLPDGSLACQTKSKQDLHIVTTNVQWARLIRDTVSAGVETYELLLEGRKNRRTKTMMTEDEVDTAAIIDKIRKENSAAIPSLNQIGGIRDVMALEEPGSERQLKGHAQHVLVLGSREAANTALDMGLSFGNEKLRCVIHSPGTQWHQQCSKCQNHNHTAQKRESRPTCGNCACKHLTKYCTSAKLRCANCHGKHGASSKSCPVWVKAERKAHRSFRFAAEDSIPRTQTAVNSPPKIAPTSPNPPQPARKCKRNHQPASIKPNPKDTSSTTASSALLQTIDAFRAFVAARENSNTQDPTTHNPRRKKRKLLESGHENESMMAGALQGDGREGKRVRREKGKKARRGEACVADWPQ